LFHADGRTHRQTEMTKLIIAFRNFTNESKNPQHIAYMASALEDSLCLADCINLRKCRRARTFVCTRLSFQFLKGFFQEFSLNTTPLVLRLSLRGFHPIDFVKQERMAELCYKAVVLTLPAYCGYTLYILNRYRAPETTLKPDLHLPPACTHFASLHQQQKFTLQYIYGNIKSPCIRPHRCLTRSFYYVNSLYINQG